MTSPVRPPIISTQIPTQGPNGARSAGQRAFFEAAMGKAPAQQAATPAGDMPARHMPKIPVNLPAEPPARILRPGSLLDIKV